MKKKEYVVRVVQTMTPDGTPVNEGDPLSDVFLECLRYAGVITVHVTDLQGLTVRCFDIHCPRGMESKKWSEMNAERMRSFGFNAVSAPRTLD